jgi:hypothetical protein
MLCRFDAGIARLTGSGTRHVQRHGTRDAGHQRAGVGSIYARLIVLVRTLLYAVLYGSMPIVTDCEGGREMPVRQGFVDAAGVVPSWPPRHIRWLRRAFVTF